VRLSRLNLKLLFAFLTVFAALFAQDSTSYLTPDVMRVGGKLACRCGGCRNTVGDCPMLRCSSADPMRHRIYDMKSHGASDNDIVSQIVREQGIVALAAPPTEGFGPLLTWIMPVVALGIGFWIYSWYVKRNRKQPEALTATDQAMIDRYRSQIDAGLEEPLDPAPGRKA
jgi:cytochrome c-type biogenesis protein CcmH/NrfF